MIQSMTGYGRGEASVDDIIAMVELRSVNSRFLEVAARLPRSLSLRENEIRELIRSKILRGKITLSASVHGDAASKVPLSINKEAARSYYKLLRELRTAVKIRETVKLEHLLSFSDIFESQEEGESDAAEWSAFTQALLVAMDNLRVMREKEGRELAHDLAARINSMQQRIDTIEQLSKERIPEERSRLQERIAAVLGDNVAVNTDRLELEIALLADKLDVTEECVRFRSHNKFFLEAIENEEGAGRKLNFLIQEMNREANTIGSKSNEITIAHSVVAMKEELEKIREQIQNIE
ncbi:MAG: YicC family protein [Bacteroidota bacterium]|nr:YicC family protein [Bacteroidota bacterium]